MRVAVIPARGGSKRIPRKNIKEFCGKPMIGWSLDCARSSNLFDAILVSTDDDEIAAIARLHGANVPFSRPPALANDYAITLDVMAHAASWMKDAGWEVSEICCIYATAPFVLPTDLSLGLDRLAEGRHSFVFAAARFSYPVQRGFVRTESGAIEMLFPEHQATRSQDLPPVFHDAGQFYWGSAHSWLSEKELLSERAGFVELPAFRVQDIDTPEDWTIAEHKFRSLQRAGAEYFRLDP